MTKQELQIKLLELVDCIVANSDGAIILITEPEGSHLSLNGERVGRDIQLYSFMSEIAGEQQLLVSLMHEVVVGLYGRAYQSYVAACEYMNKWGQQVFPEEYHEEWGQVCKPAEPR